MSAGRGGQLVALDDALSPEETAEVLNISP
jgi:hypothetical protein